MGLQTLLLCVLALVTSSRGQSQSDNFISIDCGLAGVQGYRDTTNQIVYSPDAPYIKTGVNRKVSSGYNLRNLARRYGDLRSFPNGTRNCYTLAPVQRGGKYLVRAGFVYGNYDGLNQPPEFDLYFGVNLWQTVAANETSNEIIAVAPAGSVQVCLVNKGTGTPFISALELRPLADSMYTHVNESQSLVLVGNRANFGERLNAQIRYPDDPYDRVWFTVENGKGWTSVSAEGAEVTTAAGSDIPVPSAVMRTAATMASLTQSLNFSVTGAVGKKIYVFMHFAELQKLAANETRAFDVYWDGAFSYGPFTPRYLVADLMSTDWPENGWASAQGSLVPKRNSTLPPIINALEVHYLQQQSLLPTDDRDINAVMNIKGLYQVEKNWEGDPCAPEELTWEGLNCSYNASENPRIISLNLSFSGLVGGIPASIANLTALKTLDLSHNNFTGEIPGFLAELPALHFLNLASNQLSGTIPQLLTQKSQDGSLLLSVDGNQNLCVNVGSCEVATEKKNILVPVIVAVSVFLALLLVILILVWIVKRRRMLDAHQSEPQESGRNQPRLDHHPRVQGRTDNLQPESYQYTFLEIAKITNNFERPIGRGGFGNVYHGYSPDGTEVAVKMLSETSSQGARQFLAEAQVLTRVHHKNLVSLLGYCNDAENLALVYEFMPQGSLDKHLSGNSNNINGLSWTMRLRIALEVAQGLDYLHNGCKPPIVHRDVKATNILLDRNLGAKLADFGLSRAFSNENSTHITTVVAGTLGYLDPEYCQYHRLNEKSDVYSFGVVLLELVTGQPPISNGSERGHISQWVRLRLERGDISSIADQRMQGGYDANSVWKVLDIAMACASSASFHRPTMSDVVVQLKSTLASEIARNDVSHSFNMQSPNEMVPLYLGSGFSPTAR